jgi:hypothetical protein
MTAADAPAKMSMFLRPGDLPGYTGWARPTNTLAGSFECHTATEKERSTELDVHSTLPSRSVNTVGRSFIANLVQLFFLES